MIMNTVVSLRIAALALAAGCMINSVVRRRHLLGVVASDARRLCTAPATFQIHWHPLTIGN